MDLYLYEICSKTLEHYLQLVIFELVEFNKNQIRTENNQ